jgi:hypothetical protein
MELVAAGLVGVAAMGALVAWLLAWREGPRRGRSTLARSVDDLVARARRAGL